MTISNGGTVLIAYDGSAPAQDAVAQAARLFPDGPALVVTAWHSLAAASGAGRAALPEDIIGLAVERLDATAEADAFRTAQDGADRARSAGLTASPLTIRAEPSVWASIVAAADQHGVRAVVVGSRGRSASVQPSSAACRMPSCTTAADPSSSSTPRRARTRDLTERAESQPLGSGLGPSVVPVFSPRTQTHWTIWMGAPRSRAWPVRDGR